MIAVLGLGFVGLTTALGFAEKGYKVYGFDTNEERRSALKKTRLPFHEPYLKDLLRDHLGKNFYIVDDLDRAIQESEVMFFCVGTPSKKTGETDLTYLTKALKDVLGHIPKAKRKTLVIKSSIPPSTTKNILQPIIERMGFRIGKDVRLANNPEFLREGFAWKDFIEPDRIIIGADDKRSGKTVAALYKPFGVPIFIVSLNTAEFVKYLSNSLLATMISFSNEMSLIAHAIGDIELTKAFHILHLDKRWFGEPANMATYAFPGCGFGGYCLPKDVSGIYAQSTVKGYEPLLLKEVMNVNKKIKDHVAEIVARKAGKNEHIGVLGLSFKPNSDDVRETPAKDIIGKLLQKGFGHITAYDPLAMENFHRAYRLPIAYAQSLEEVIKKSDHLVILTAWDLFRKQKRIMLKKSVFDFRYILENALTPV